MYTLPPWWNHNIKKSFASYSLPAANVIHTNQIDLHFRTVYTKTFDSIIRVTIYRKRPEFATRSGVCQVNRVRDERHAWTIFLMQKDVRFSNKIRFGGVLCVRGTRWRHRPPAPRRSFDQIRGVARFQYSNHARLTHIAVLSLYFASGCV